MNKEFALALIILCFIIVAIIFYLRLKRKRVMEVICDTHIWYELGNTEKEIQIGENIKLVATFNSIDEFSRTENLLRDYEYTRKGIQAMFKYSRTHAIYEPPLIYLKKLANPEFHYDIQAQQASILKFTSNVAKGQNIDLERSAEYRAFCKERKSDLEVVSKIFNDQSAEIKPKIKNLKIHREEDSIPINRHLISLFVEKFSKSSGLPETFNWGLIELFENVLKVYFNALETGEYKSDPNDWYDLFLLIYVQPGRKVWTKEKRWLTLIKRCGMDKYLYNPEN